MTDFLSVPSLERSLSSPEEEGEETYICGMEDFFVDDY
jgi:hypothetical protein